jgi:hypothetical protein
MRFIVKGNFDQIWDNLLKISQGDSSVYERITSSFEKKTGFFGNSSSAQYGGASSSDMESGKAARNTHPRN